MPSPVHRADLGEKPSRAAVLLVADGPQLLGSGRIALCTAGCANVVAVQDGPEVPRLLTRREVSLIVLDLSMVGVPGRAILNQVATEHPDIPIIVLIGAEEGEAAIDCLQAGAVDCVVKPVEQSRLAAAVRKALAARPFLPELLERKRRFRTGESHFREAFAEIVTEDHAMYAMFSYLEAICFSPQPVLITGETGTGKELVAKALHKLSRRPGELVTVNVAGLDDTLFSDTLFGHTKGAYTGAERPRGGLIMAAADGTLFLDEVGDLTAASQVKLLRLLEDGAYYALGADRPLRTNARIVVATNRDLGEQVAAGTFRKDLYFRLRTHELQLPPVRERRDDIPLLLKYFIDDAARVLGKPAPAVPFVLLTMLHTYEFPGNVRELRAMAFDAVARHGDGPLCIQSFKNSIGAGATLATHTRQNPEAAFRSLFRDRLPTLHEVEEALTNEAMARADGNQGAAASILGISRQALNKRLSRRRNSHA